MSQYVLVLEENGIRKKIHVGKKIYSDAEIGSKWTVGIIGRKLINIRQGYADQVKLIEWKESDANALFEMCLDETLRKNGIYYYDTIEEARNVIKHWQNMKGSKVIIEKETNSFVGFIILSDMNRYDGYMELEYAIEEKYRNKGYATQAIKKMIDYGFREMNLCAIAAWVRSHNVASVKCLEKNHFVFEGRLRKHARDKSDTLCFSLLREDWENINKDNICEIEDMYKD
ncbi:MAG: GNAT family N-acetyltransferase [Lachnospiraceae bacterium]|nr:GNAT family N-acetyltransferase [Lachnospiraceae bacterium]